MEMTSRPWLRPTVLVSCSFPQHFLIKNPRTSGPDPQTTTGSAACATVPREMSLTESRAAQEPAPLLEIHRDVTAGKLRLRTTEWSTAPGDHRHEAIVALPGAWAPRSSFRKLGELLGRSFRFIAVDFPGFGESEKPSPQRYPYGPSAFAEAMIDLFSGLGLSRAHVLGHGLGGAVAIHLSARHPELVRRLALMAPWGAPGPGLAWKALVAPLLGGLVFRQVIGRQLFSTLYKERIQPQASAALISEYYAAFTPPAARAALLATLRAATDRRAIIADSRRIRSPTLIVWGVEDAVFPVERGRLLSREMPRAGLEIVGTGHTPHEENPELLAPILDRFFAGRRTGAG